MDGTSRMVMTSALRTVFLPRSSLLQVGMVRPQSRNSRELRLRLSQHSAVFTCSSGYGRNGNPQRALDRGAQHTDALSFLVSRPQHHRPEAGLTSGSKHCSVRLCDIDQHGELTIFDAYTCSKIDPSGS